MPSDVLNSIEEIRSLRQFIHDQGKRDLELLEERIQDVLEDSEQ